MKLLDKALGKWANWNSTNGAANVNSVGDGKVVRVVHHRPNVTAAGQIVIAANQNFTKVSVIATPYASTVTEDISGMFIVNDSANAVALFNGGVYPDSSNVGDWPVYITPLNQFISSVDLSAETNGRILTIDYSPLRGVSAAAVAINFMFILEKVA